MQEIHLPAALEFAQAGFAHLSVRHLGHEGFDCQALLRRRGDHREVAQAVERKSQGARNRCRGQRQDVDRGAEGFQRFFLTHSKAMFFIDDDQTETLELHVLLQQPVRADQDVDLALFQLHNGLGLFLGTLEARNLGDAHGKTGEAVGKILVVLFGQQGGRAEHGNLLAIGDGHKSGA